MAAVGVLTLSVGVLAAPLLLVGAPRPGGLFLSYEVIRAERATTMHGYRQQGFELLPPVDVQTWLDADEG